MPDDRSRPATSLDDVNRRIVEQLQQDGRRSYAAIGKAVGLSEAAARQRVQRLVESGVMQVVAVTDPVGLGFTRQATVGVRVDGPVGPVVDALAGFGEVARVVVTTGPYDLLVDVVAETDEDLLRVVSERIRRVGGVTGTETFVHLQVHPAGRVRKVP